jgi:N-glycosylase/DNA lyase
VVVKGINEMQVRIEDDLDLKKISASGQCFRWTEISPGKYQIIAQDKCLRIKALREKLFELDCSEEEYNGFWFNYLDLGESYEWIRRRINKEKDEFLFLAAEYEKGIRILRQDPWEMLITFIISQNKNIPAIRRSVEKLAELCGMEMTNGAGVRYFAFPTPDALAELQDDQLKECGLGYRCRYVREAAKAVADGRLDLLRLRELDEDKAMTTLTGLTGVGKKVASCVSLFGLHHLNSFPIDVWIKRILEEQYPEGYPFEEYSPYNGVYQQYMFDYYRNTSMFSR